MEQASTSGASTTPEQPSDAHIVAEEVPGGSEPAKPGKKKYRQIVMPSPEQMMQEEFMNNCATRTVVSAAMGSVLGLFFGVLMGTMDGAGVGMDSNMATQQKQTVREVAKQMFTTARSRSWAYAKGFGAMGAMFAGSECVVEKLRAKHDIYNSVYAGCFTGAALAHKAGPKAMCAGCATFAAFSAAIDHFLTHD